MRALLPRIGERATISDASGRPPDEEGAMTDSQFWLDQQAIERLAQHIPFEADLATKAEQIEMLRGLVLRVGRHIDREDFGFEASQELRRLGLWDRLGGAEP